jgi:transcriptional regulator with XRE-family HTH domain
MPQTATKLRSTFLLEVALDQERLKQRIAQVLRQHRASLGPGYPQERVAPLYSVSFSTYQRWERGISMPRWNQLEKIAEVTGLSVAELVDDGATPAAAAAEEGEVLQRLDEIVARLERLEKAAGVRKPPRARPAAGSSRRGSG